MSNPFETSPARASNPFATTVRPRREARRARAMTARATARARDGDARDDDDDDATRD